MSSASTNSSGPTGGGSIGARNSWLPLAVVAAVVFVAWLILRKKS